MTVSKAQLVDALDDANRQLAELGADTGTDFGPKPGDMTVRQLRQSLGAARRRLHILRRHG